MQHDKIGGSEREGGSDRERRLSIYKGRGRAPAWIRHAGLVVIAYHMLGRDEPYSDLGAKYDPFRHSRDAETRRLVRRLEAAGNKSRSIRVATGPGLRPGFAGWWAGFHLRRLGLVPHRVDATRPGRLYDLPHEAVDAEWPLRRACHEPELGEDRAYRWTSRRPAGRSLSMRARSPGAATRSSPALRPQTVVSALIDLLLALFEATAHG